MVLQRGGNSYFVACLDACRIANIVKSSLGPVGLDKYVWSTFMEVVCARSLTVLHVLHLSPDRMLVDDIGVRYFS